MCGPFDLCFRKHIIHQGIFWFITVLFSLASISCGGYVQQKPTQAAPIETLSSPNVTTQTETPVVENEQTLSLEAATPTPSNGEEEQEISGDEETQKSNLPIFDQFIEDLKTGEADKIVGLWVENVMALRVVYQPANDPSFVSTIDNVATYFMYPWQKAGNHGLLAHNYLAGRFFFDVKLGDIVTLVFGDGNYMDFEVTEIKAYQALQPNSPYTNFIDLESGEQLTVNNVFIDVYMGDFHTVLQTCIAMGSETEWGRNFTIAPPLY